MSFALRIMAGEFASAAKSCGQVIGSAQIPILKCVRISVDGNQATFIATNTEQTIINRAACEGQGVACIDYAMLAGKIGALNPKSPVEIDGDGKSITVKQGRARWKIPVLLDDFPMLVIKPVVGTEFEMKSDILRAIAIAKDATDPRLQSSYAGVWLSRGKVIATNGKQIRAFDFPPLAEIDCTLPDGFTKAIAQMKDGGQAVVSANEIMLTVDRTTVKSRLLEYKPADMTKGFDFLLANSPNAVEVQRPTFLTALRNSISILPAGDSASFINTRVDFKADGIEFYSRNMKGEEGLDGTTFQCPIESGVGVPGDIFAAMVAAFPFDAMTVCYGEPKNSILLKSAGVLMAMSPRVFS